MKNGIILAIGLAIALMFSGCASSSSSSSSTPAEKKEVMVNTTNNLPSWVINPKVEGGISAVGMTGYSKHGMQVMIPQAEMDARAKLAGKIQTIVSQVQKRAMRHVKINDLDEFENSFKQATKEIIKKMPLSGAQRINLFQAKNGDLYVHTIIQKRVVSEHLGDMKTSYKKHMKEAKVSRQSIDEGMKVLDDMMKELDVETK